MDSRIDEQFVTDDSADDLLWMLQSGQVSKRLLIEELVSRYYQEIYYLAYTILEDNRASSETVQRTLANAVVSSRTLREDVDIDIWLYKIAWDDILQALSREWFWRKLEKFLLLRGEFTEHISATPITPEIGTVWYIFERKLAPSNRRLLILHSVHCWPVKRITQIVGADTSDVLRDIDQTWQIVHNNLDAVGSSEQEVRNSFTKALLLRWNRYNIPSVNQDQIVEHICLLAGDGNSIRNLGRFIKDISVLLIALITIAVLIWAVFIS